MQSYKYEWQGAYQRKIEEGRARGEAEGEAKAIVKLLQSRGVETTDDQIQAILTCTDLVQLDVWFGRALNATTADEVFSARERARIPGTLEYAWNKSLACALENAAAEAQADKVLRMLDTFGVALTEEQRKTIKNCLDHDRIDRLFNRALGLAAAHDDFNRSLAVWVAEKSANG